jgi:sulfite reductase alpha subunit-like flavoprotein
LVPLVLIGPGTGCAPFCTFVDERAAAQAEHNQQLQFYFSLAVEIKIMIFYIKISG